MSSDPNVAPALVTDELIARCLSGDQEAWEQIVRQHWRKVFNLAYKFVGRHDEAEPLFQTSREWRRERYPEGHWRHAELDLYEAACLAANGRAADATRRIEAVRVLLGRMQPPNQSLIRLAGMLCIEQNDECLVGRGYLSAESISLVLADRDDHPPKENKEEVPALQVA